MSGTDKRVATLDEIYHTSPITVVDALRRVSWMTTEGYTFMDSAGNKTFRCFRDLCRLAEERGQRLLSMGLVRGDRVAMVLSQPEDFVLTYLGALMAGLVAVPMFPPLSFGRLDAYMDSALNILNVAGAKLLVTDKQLSSVLWQMISRAATLKDIITAEKLDTHPLSGVPLPEIAPQDIAFLQFTSGSTSAPKGVTVTHANLVANCWAIATEGVDLTSGRDRVLSWLPLYHDMGLIGFVITPMFRGVSSFFIPTMSFVKRPNIWMQQMHETRSTVSFGPNFAFALAAKRATDEDLARWDLSCVRTIGCGAEPIHPGVMQEFQDRMSRAGMRPAAVMPSYGMAEATLAMSFHKWGTEIEVATFDAERFRASGEVHPPVDDTLTLSFVSCGKPFSGHAFRAVGGDGQVQPEGVEGELQFSGPSVTPGYWENPDATAAAFDDGWLKTGDLGFIWQGNIFITGRCKDLIILNGRNHHPQTIEWSVAEVEGVRKGNVVAFSRPGKDSEELVLACEVKDNPSPDLVEMIKKSVSDQLSLRVVDVILLKVGQLPKTSSGKLQRRKTREQYLAGTLGGEGVRTLGSSGETLNVAKHVGRSLIGRVSHFAGGLFGAKQG